MTGRTYALIASVELNGQPVGDACVPPPQPFAAAHWVGRDRVRVTDGRGERHELRPGNRVIIEAGGVRLDLRLVERFSLTRSGPAQWRSSVAWLAMLLGITLMAQQGNLLYENRCRWFWWMPLASTYWACGSTQASDYGGGMAAEYLERLLRHDYDGADEGVVAVRDIREIEERIDGIYMPAGADGPYDEMGGAAEVGAEPDRVPEEEAVEAAAPEKHQLALDEGGEPIPKQDFEEVESTSDDFDGVAEVEDAEAQDAQVPVEEELGWGIQDWMDASPLEREKMEVELQIAMSQERVRIDPDDPDALGLLAYYQYLASDYDAAIETFDRLIEHFPEEAFGYNNKALVYKRLKEYRKEEGLYRIALAYDPLDTTAMNNLAVNLAHQHRFDEALAYMDELATLTPNDPYADLHRAKIYAEMGESDLAMAFLDKALRGVRDLGTMHHIEFRQDIRVDPSFEKLRATEPFRAMLREYYGDDSPLVE